MKPSYSDIIERAGAPDWWSGDGVPRYGVFAPSKLGYGQQAALFEVGCQACGRRFLVADIWDHLESDRDSLVEQLQTSGEIWWGDPPNVNCCPPGGSMNADFIRLLELHMWINYKWVKTR